MFYIYRLTPDGLTLVYLENDLRTNDGQGQSDFVLTPGKNIDKLDHFFGKWHGIYLW